MQLDESSAMFAVNIFYVKPTVFEFQAIIIDFVITEAVNLLTSSRSKVMTDFGTMRLVSC